MAGASRPTNIQLREYGKLRELTSSDYEIVNYQGYAGNAPSYAAPLLFDGLIPSSSYESYSHFVFEPSTYVTLKINKPCNIWVMPYQGASSSFTISKLNIENVDTGETIEHEPVNDWNHPGQISLISWHLMCRIDKPGTYKFKGTGSGTNARQDAEWFLQALPVVPIPDVEEETVVTQSQLYTGLGIAKLYIDDQLSELGSNIDIVDNLESTSSTSALSAKQGKVLSDAINSLDIPTNLSDLTEDSSHKFVSENDISNWNSKVDAVSGKGLSTEDFTTAMKNKLEELEVPTMITGTLTAGEETITITNSKIVSTGIYTFYTSIYGVSPKEVNIINGSATLTFEPQIIDMTVGIKIM